MVLVPTPSIRWPVASFLRRVIAALALSLAALPAAAQDRLWIRQLGTATEDSAGACAPDGSGGVYVSGRTFGSLGGPNAGNDDVWLARYDGAGSQIWVLQFGTSGDEQVNGAAADGAGGVYVVGDTLGSLGGPSAGGRDAWLARYDGAGNRLWIRQLGTSGDDRALAAAPDGAGGVYVGGSTSGSLGGPAAGSGDAWLARYDAAGNQLWIRQPGTGFYDFARALAPDGSNGVYAGGATHGSLGGPNAGYQDAWLARYDSAGNQLWVRQLGTSLNDDVQAAAPDGSGGVYASGRTDGNLGGAQAGANDVWVARYDGAGNQIWIRQFGTSTYDYVEAAAPEPSGGVYLSGWTAGSLGGPSAGSFDAWLARFDGAGNQVWTDQLGTSTDDMAQAAAPDGSGGVYVSGGTYGSLAGPNAVYQDAWLARYDSSCGPISSYCTAKTTSTGCTPAIGWIGAQSRSGGPGTFDVTLSGTRPNKPYICFYSVNTARHAAPFQGGFLCAQPPVRRTAVELTSNGGECASGTSVDFGAILSSAGFISAGDVLRAQWWGRDTPGNSSLSDAVELTVCP